MLSLDNSAVVLHWCELGTYYKIPQIYCSKFDNNACIKVKHPYELFTASSSK